MTPPSSNHHTRWLTFLLVQIVPLAVLALESVRLWAIF